ncbi:MAG TPA: type II toxin-antitoxin system Phd/YefM family antitoxin [Crinalium sp.]|jgi:PHD/YefM family antitoxin component YafN of YafNO toxin-antitoxin module
MTDPATLTATAIATLAFTKFLEGSAGKAAEKFTEAAIAKMDELRQQIWAKLRGRSRVETVKAAIEQTAKADQAQVNQVAAYLQVAMDEDPQFAKHIQALAHEITLMQVEDNSSMTQINYGGTNYQTQIGTDNTNFFSIAEMQAHPAQVLEQAAVEPILLTQDTEPSYVILSIQGYQQLLERLEALENAALGQLAETALQTSHMVGSETFTRELYRLASLEPNQP